MSDTKLVVIDETRRARLGEIAAELGLHSQELVNRALDDFITAHPLKKEEEENKRQATKRQVEKERREHITGVRSYEPRK